MNSDETRSARLLFSDALARGGIELGGLEHPEVQRAVRTRAVPPRALRLVARAAVKAGLRGYERECVEPFVRARAAVLGSAAAGPPRFLVRVDEFPNVSALDEPGRFGAPAFERFDAVLSGAGVPYLIAALPRLSRRPYDPGATGGRGLDESERETLRRLRGAGVEVAVHGLDHRTRDARPRRHSELLGLSRQELEDRLDAADAVLAELGVEPRVFVPAFNRFSHSQYSQLARRYEIICGGPESIVEMGLQRTPLFREGAVYMPAYAPAYGRARDVLPVVERMIEREAALWVPVVLHWSWEQEDDFEGLARLVDRLAPFAAPWSEFLEIAARTRERPQGAG